VVLVSAVRTPFEASHIGMQEVRLLVAGSKPIMVVTNADRKRRIEERTWAL
jgi:hypothetical protein